MKGRTIKQVDPNLRLTNTNMSTFAKLTKNPATGKWEIATWIDDFFGRHQYGVKFPDGTVYNPEYIKLQTKKDDSKEHKQRKQSKVGTKARRSSTRKRS